MSSINPVSASGIARVPAHESRHNQRKLDMSALSDALSNNDLAGAQEAFQQLQKDAPGLARLMSKSSGKAGDSQGTPGGFAALSSALEGGDVEAAKKAFQEIQQNHRRYPQTQTSTTSQVLGMGVEAIGPNETNPNTGTILNTSA